MAGLRLRCRPATAALRLHAAPLVERWRHLAAVDRADGQYRHLLQSQVPLGAGARSAARPGWLPPLGQRRGWLLVIQPLLVAGLRRAWRSATRPRPGSLFARCRRVAFLSASQDIAIDAWRIELFPERCQGLGVGGLCVGLPRGAAGVGVRGDRGWPGRLGWRGALLALAALVALGPVLTLLAPSPADVAAAPRLARPCGAACAAVVAPLAELLRRRGAVLPLAFVLLFKLGEAMAGTMAPRSTARSASTARRSRWPSASRRWRPACRGAAAGAWLVARLGAAGRWC